MGITKEKEYLLPSNSNYSRKEKIFFYELKYKELVDAYKCPVY